MSKTFIETPNDIIQRAIKRAYAQKNRPAVVDRELWESERKTMEQSLEGGWGKEFAKLKFGSVDWEKVQNLRYNIAVFDAFKSNKQVKEAHKLLFDKFGEVRPFKDFKTDALKVADKYNQRWLQTEYNQAHTSAKAARQWVEFEKDADLYPNLEYVVVGDDRTRASHAALAGTILPIKHPFWSRYYPPNDWACRCSVSQTDAKPTKVPENAPEVKGIFDQNVGITAKVFNESHDYFKNVSDSEKQKIYYFVEQNICNSKTVMSKWKDYNKYSEEKLFFDGNTGGFVTAKTQRIEKSKISKNEAQKYEKETAMCQVLAKNGYKVEMLEEHAGVSSPDLLVNGVATELKKCSSHNNVAKYGKKAIQQGAKMVVFQFDNVTQDCRQELCKLQSRIKVFYFANDNFIHTL